MTQFLSKMVISIPQQIQLQSMGCNTGTEHETVAEIDIAATFNLRNITQETDHTSKEALIS